MSDILASPDGFTGGMTAGISCGGTVVRLGFWGSWVGRFGFSIGRFFGELGAGAALAASGYLYVQMPVLSKEAAKAA